MRTTVRIEEALLLELKDKAAQEKISLTRLLNRILRSGLQAEREDRKPRRQHREKTHSMGVPRVDLTKSLSLADQIEADEVLRKVRLRK